MPKIENKVLLDVISENKGLSTQELIDKTPYSSGSYGLISLRLQVLEAAGKIRSEVGKRPSKKTGPVWWPVTPCVD